MAVLPYNPSSEEKELLTSWENIEKARVLRDFTSDYNGRFSTVKKGTESHRYSHCYFYFYDEDGNEVGENVFQVAVNSKYFEKAD
jgi:hypothetical protein